MGSLWCSWNQRSAGVQLTPAPSLRPIHSKPYREFTSQLHDSVLPCRLPAMPRKYKCDSHKTMEFVGNAHQTYSLACENESGPNLFKSAGSKQGDNGDPVKRASIRLTRWSQCDRRNTQLELTRNKTTKLKSLKVRSAGTLPRLLTESSRQIGSPGEVTALDQLGLDGVVDRVELAAVKQVRTPDPKPHDCAYQCRPPPTRVGFG